MTSREERREIMNDIVDKLVEMEQAINDASPRFVMAANGLFTLCLAFTMLCQIYRCRTGAAGPPDPKEPEGPGTHSINDLLK